MLYTTDLIIVMMMMMMIIIIIIIIIPTEWCERTDASVQFDFSELIYTPRHCSAWPSSSKNIFL